MTAAEFSSKTRWYWMADTGVGLGVILGTSLSLIVGTVIVGQTMYSAAIERMKEYGTLKALGMTNMELAGIIARQAIITGMVGYIIGSTVACTIGKQLPKFNVPVEVPFQVVIVMFFVTVAMCVVASISSIVRVFRLEPATVFRS
jgi:putative ABC transport system permease protein